MKSRWFDAVKVDGKPSVAEREARSYNLTLPLVIMFLSFTMFRKIGAELGGLGDLFK